LTRVYMTLAGHTQVRLDIPMSLNISYCLFFNLRRRRK
jgi:hypothetical protein